MLSSKKSQSKQKRKAPLLTKEGFGGNVVNLRKWDKKYCVILSLSKKLTGTTIEF